MIRFILKERTTDTISGLDRTTFRTLDIECLDLESYLNSGGFHENGSLSIELVNVEVLNRKDEGWESCS